MSSASEQFDGFAPIYEQALDVSIRISGEGGQYFAELKARYLAALLGPGFRGKILDFGCGVGILSRFLAKHLPDSQLHGYDVSAASIQRVDPELALRARFTADKSRLDSDYDLIVIANVMHHVPVADRSSLIADLRSLLAPHGTLVVFEHNPANPGTRWAVSHCAFDFDAVLLWPRELRRYTMAAGMKTLRRDYVIFFPRLLACFRPLEPLLRWCPLGAQYVTVCQR